MAATGLVVVLLTGCVTSTDAQKPGLAVDETFSVGFVDIEQIYIEDEKVSTFALAGLEGLSSIDSDIVVDSATNNLRLAVGTREAGRFDRPSENDAEGWAAVLTQAVAAGRTASPKLAAASNEDVYSAVFRNVARRLDPYSRYADAEQARQNRQKRRGYGGIGIKVKRDEGGARIVSVLDGKPAAKSGLKAGDLVLEIDGKSIADESMRAVVKMLRGPLTQPVRLTIQRPEEATRRAVEIERAHITPQTVFYEPAGDIAILRIASFNKMTAESVRDAVAIARAEQGRALRGLVLDLRGNPGGLLDQSVEVADLFIHEGRIITTRGRHKNSLQIFDATPGDIAEGLPIAVLVNGSSASAAEILASALQDHGRAVLVGATSFGKGTVQTVLRLPNDGELILTWARIHAPSGYALNAIGVLPQICTSLSDDPRDIVQAALSASGSADVMLAKRRAANDNDTRQVQELKQLCPWRKRDGGDIDKEVAELILKTQDRYDLAVQLARGAAIN